MHPFLCAYIARDAYYTVNKPNIDKAIQRFIKQGYSPKKAKKMIKKIVWDRVRWL